MLSQSVKKLVADLLSNSESCAEFDMFSQSVPLFSPQYIECRFNHDPSLDYLYCINTQESLDEFPLNASTRQGIEALLQACPRIPYIWLEYDNIQQGNFSRDPCWHACISPNYLSTSSQSPIEFEELLAVMRLLTQSEGIDPSLKSLLHRLHQRNVLIHLSCMRERVNKSVKLFIKLPANGVQALLNDIGWPGDFSTVKHLLQKPWLRPVGNGVVSLDLKWEGCLLPYIGLVESRITLTKPPGPQRLAGLIEQGVLQSDHHIHNVMRWLDRDQNPSARWIDLKTTNDGEGTQQTKAYFGFQDTTEAFIRRFFG
ncbi:hypothetical protein [Marinibactrum halimedae]|uniref:Uncharacterized protein n=1 Tax=Marinibactrum halimedae TaxID=1444977 RepID=A0AA37TD53_9GAMM|nr:hypothetical protein [Marinibactrum halimedae]MCD9460966.1 hypothetical protein [Marinibactrum halimedae]GLS28091.1 hypothetical protein GCM10007877_38100 [Marinibactrum halimedae]